MMKLRGRCRGRGKNKSKEGQEPSMLVDVRNNRPIEVEAILGNTVNIAKEHHVEVHYLELLYVLA
jgi:2-dehydropantoate 2-reductase